MDGERLPERSWHRLLLRQQVGLGGPLSEEPELFVFMVTDTDPNIAVSGGVFTVHPIPGRKSHLMVG